MDGALRWMVKKIGRLRGRLAIMIRELKEVVGVTSVLEGCTDVILGRNFMYDLYRTYIICT